jgi:hypothetical protein
VIRRALCETHGVLQSMGKTGVCWDNTLAESFFATYKLELIEPASWPTRARARTATVHWLQAIYNRRRRHSAIDMLSPVDYEDRYWDRRAAAQLRCLPGRGKTTILCSVIETKITRTGTGRRTAWGARCGLSGRAG